MDKFSSFLNYHLSAAPSHEKYIMTGILYFQCADFRFMLERTLTEEAAGPSPRIGSTWAFCIYG